MRFTDPVCVFVCLAVCAYSQKCHVHAPLLDIVCLWGLIKHQPQRGKKRRPPSPPLLTPLENTCSFVVCVTLSSALLANRRLIRLV